MTNYESGDDIKEPFFWFEIEDGERVVVAKFTEENMEVIEAWSGGTVETVFGLDGPHEVLAIYGDYDVVAMEGDYIFKNKYDELYVRSGPFLYNDFACDYEFKVKRQIWPFVLHEYTDIYTRDHLTVVQVTEDNYLDVAEWCGGRLKWYEWYDINSNTHRVGEIDLDQMCYPFRLGDCVILVREPMPSYRYSTDERSRVYFTINSKENVSWCVESGAYENERISNYAYGVVQEVENENSTDPIG